MASTKTRSQIVDECAGAVLACWNHYANEPLTVGDGDKEEITKHLSQALPKFVNTSDWQVYANNYQKMVEEEDS